MRDPGPMFQGKREAWWYVPTVLPLGIVRPAWATRDCLIFKKKVIWRGLSS